MITFEFLQLLKMNIQIIAIPQVGIPVIVARSYYPILSAYGLQLY